MTVYDVPINDLILKVAAELEKMPELTPPSWSDFAKTGAHKQRAPTQANWWFIRAASVLNTIQKIGPVGVSKLRTKYGGKKNRGHKPEKFCRASGNILRKILQQLEKAGLAKKAEKGVHKGRIITPQGAKILGKAAEEVMKEQKITIPKKSTEELDIEMPKQKKTAKKKKTTRKKAARKRAPRKKAEQKTEAPAETELKAAEEI